MKKIKFIFTYSELRAFVDVISHLPKHECNMFNAARDEMFFKMALKLAQKLMNTKKQYSVTFNMVESFFLYKTLKEIFGKITTYENILIIKIINNIHQLTC